MRRFPLALAVLLVAFACPSQASAAENALTFDGTNDYVAAGLDPTANANTSARTWEAWVKTTATGGYGIVERGLHVYPWNRYPWSMSLSNGKPAITVMNNQAASARWASVNVNDGEWHHIAAVWEPGTRLDIYVDGVKKNGTLRSFASNGAEQNPAVVLSSMTIAANEPIKIGVSSNQGSLDGYFPGTIDGVHYSQGARYAGTFEPTRCPQADAQTIGLWNFDEGSGTTTAPQGQITSNATLTNGPMWTSAQSCATAFTALELDGTNDYLNAGLDPTAASNTSARTWEAWVKTTATGTYGLVDRGIHVYPWTRYPWSLSLAEGKPNITVMHNQAASARWASETVNDGEWHHIAAVWEPGTRLDIYIDGVKENGTLRSFDSNGAEQSNPVVLSSITVAANEQIKIGVSSYQGSLDGYYPGKIDGVRYSQGARYDANFTPDPCPEVDANTIGLWTFDEGSGTTTAPQGQMTAAATLLNGPTWVVGPSCTGPLKAIEFDGANDYLSAGTDPTASDNGSARTWETWVRTTRATGWQGIADRGVHIYPWNRYAWSFHIEAGKPAITVMNNQAASARWASASIADGEWHHVAAVWEPGSRLDVYIDGVKQNGTLRSFDSNGAEQTTPVVLSSITVASTEPIRIGAGTYQGNLDGFFDGRLDGLRYSEGARYSGAFTPTTAPAADADTIGLWTFDEGTGTSTATAGQMTGSATLVNGPIWAEGPTT